MQVLNSDITKAIESLAPLHLQEDWDNSGYQIGNPGEECSGVLICVDVTPEIIKEAVAKKCNLIITHHPLMFRGVKQIMGRNRVERTIAEAIRNGITVYSSHTAVDNAPQGVSGTMAKMLGLTDCHALMPIHGIENAGCGIVGVLPAPLSPDSLVKLVKRTFDSPIARCSDIQGGLEQITTVALCGGAGAEFIPAAIERGAQAYITSDTKLNYFLDYIDDIFLIDIGHYESEKCTKHIFYHLLSEKFPNFALFISESEKNPINYL